MTASNVEACAAKQKHLWAEVAVNQKYLCKPCTLKGVTMNSPMLYYAVCVLEDKRTTGRYYLVSRKDLYSLHRAVQGDRTQNLNPVSMMPNRTKNFCDV